MSAAAATANMSQLPTGAPTGALTKPVLKIDPSNLALAPKSLSGFTIPTITITPPDSAPQYSSPVPEQTYEKTVLFVPVKTEELGWDEHGLYWNGTYAYPVHEIYDKEGLAIGRRRKGPAGYRFEEYYDAKKPKRSSTDQGVEEANVRLDEPAPARVETAKCVALAEDKVEDRQSEPMKEEDIVSPTSPTLSVASEMSEDASSVCDDSASLWSRADDDESVCTSPGLMSPPSMDVDRETFAPETLSKKLSDLAPSSPTKNSWLSLGTLPSCSSPWSATSSSRPQSLPIARTNTSKRVTELSQSHRASSTPIVEQRRHSTSSPCSSSSAYNSIIQDLTTSAFAASTMASKSPFRSATLPRATSRTAYSQNKMGGGSVLRPPPQFASFSNSSISSSSGSDNSRKTLLGSRSASKTAATSNRMTHVDFSAGWSFESHSAMHSDRWDDSFASHY